MTDHLQLRRRPGFLLAKPAMSHALLRSQSVIHADDRGNEARQQRSCTNVITRRFEPHVARCEPLATNCHGRGTFLNGAVSMPHRPPPATRQCGGPAKFSAVQPSGQPDCNPEALLLLLPPSLVRVRALHGFFIPGTVTAITVPRSRVGEPTNVRTAFHPTLNALGRSNPSHGCRAGRPRPAPETCARHRRALAHLSATSPCAGSR